MALLLPKIETRPKPFRYNGMIYPAYPMMTATTTTTTSSHDGRLAGLPKNKTGLFAAETIQEVKPSKAHPLSGTNNASTRHRLPITSHIITGGSSVASSDRYSQSSVGPESVMSVNSDFRRNAFPPSTVRRQKLRMTTMTSRREAHKQDSRDLSSKQSFYSSPASARLKAEIDHIQSKLKIHHDLNKSLLAPSKQEPTHGISNSALSYQTTCRISSASTIHTHSRMHPRLPSAVTTTTMTNYTSGPTMIDTSIRSLNSSLGYPIPSPPTHEEETSVPKSENNDQVTHAYQIPQLSNVGSESVFVANPSSSLSARSRSRRGKQLLATCPFYVMYFSNLSLQQKPVEQANETVKKTPRPSRASSSYYQRYTTLPNGKRSTSVERDEDLFASSSYHQHKDFTAKIAAFENENSHLLKDLLRTTSWNHVQV